MRRAAVGGGASCGVCWRHMLAASSVISWGIRVILSAAELIGSQMRLLACALAFVRKNLGFLVIAFSQKAKIPLLAIVSAVYSL